MGLSIYAYSKLTRRDAPPGDDDDDDVLEVFVNPDFPERASDLVDGAIYAFDACEEALCRAYSAYSTWRNELARLAGYPAVTEGMADGHRPYSEGAWEATGGPFWELINFSDCEGVIGPEVCRKLATDFDEWAATMATSPDLRFVACYQQFHRAMRLAADGGCLDFG